MQIQELKDISVLILGLGVEGRSTFRFLRSAYPTKTLGLADQQPAEALSMETRQMIAQDSHIRLHCGADYLSSLANYDVIVKSPGISSTRPENAQAFGAGKLVTSQTALIFANFRGTILGITGTKGKSTTASLLYAMVKKEFPDTHLVGNIGTPALDLLNQTGPETRFVYELSSHQLEGLRQSPHIAVLLNIVPEHLDYYENFNQYVDAKENITRFQAGSDFLVYDADYALPRLIAERSPAQLIQCSLDPIRAAGCFPSDGWMVFRSGAREEERLFPVAEVPLLGRFNLINVAAAAAAAKVAGVATNHIADAVREFVPLEHRLERVGDFGGVTFFNDSIATVPEAAIAALDSLGANVETILLGGSDRGLNFSALALRLAQSGVKTVILFPPSGERIWKAICERGAESALPQQFLVDSMEEAVKLAKRHTTKGKICLLSPSSPSFGLFRDYRERGNAFKRLVKAEDKRREPMDS